MQVETAFLHSLRSRFLLSPFVASSTRPRPPGQRGLLPGAWASSVLLLTSGPRLPVFPPFRVTGAVACSQVACRRAQEVPFCFCFERSYHEMVLDPVKGFLYSVAIGFYSRLKATKSCRFPSSSVFLPHTNTQNFSGSSSDLDGSSLVLVILVRAAVCLGVGPFRGHAPQGTTRNQNGNDSLAGGGCLWHAYAIISSSLSRL